MQKITLIGNIGRDPEYKQTQSGRNMLTFPMAVNKYNGKESAPTWYRICTMNYSDRFASVLKKGSSIVVVGDLDARGYLDKNGGAGVDLTVWADSMEFPPMRDNNSQSGTTRTTQVTAVPQTEAGAPTIDRQAPVATPVAQAAPVQDEGADDLPF